MEDINKLITDNLDIWTQAIEKKSATGRGSSKKHTLYGIKKLRELILDLAVRGKLVPQDPNDEPASELLKRIEAKKEQLIKDKKIKKQKPFSIINEDDKVYSIPENWCVVRFGEIMFNRDSERIPLSVDARKLRQGPYDYYGASSVIDHIDDYLFDKPLLLIGEDGANLLSRSTPIAFIAKGKYWVNNHAHVLDGISEQFLEYIALYINAISLVPYVTGTAQPKMNQTKMGSIIVCLPPELEQSRIVSKVNELMTLCDQLEQQTEDSITAHKTLVETLLNTLTNSKDNNELTQNWNRISDYFDILFTTEESIDLLKQTILQLAVMGKLVPQDPNDEPASELLKRIEAEKEQLIKDKKIKKPKKINVNFTPEITVPFNWEFLLVNEFSFVTKLAGFEYSKHIKLEDKGEIPVIRAQNVKPFRLDTTNIKYIDEKTSKELPRSALVKPSILITFIGAGIGDICVFSKTERWHLAPNVAKLEPYIGINLEFLAIYLNSSQGKKEIYKSMKSTAQPSISMTTIREIWCPIPPYKEQKRIVSKVNELMTLCDELSDKLKTERENKVVISDAIVQFLV